MFEFAQPWALALLPVIPLVLWRHWRQPRPAVSWPGAAELASIADRKSDLLELTLLALALLAGVLALSRPRQNQPGEQLSTEGIAIMLLVDVSGSMAEVDFDWSGEKISRLDAVKRGFSEVVANRPHDRLGLILFAAQPETACPLTMDHRAILATLTAAEPRGVPTESETNLGDAIAWGIARMQQEKGRKVMIVCSDGEHNVPSPALTPRQAAQLAAAADVRINALFAGPANGPGLDPLQAIGRMTGGTAWEAHDSQGLTRACDELDEIEKIRNQDQRRLKYREWYPWLASGAAALLLLAIVHRLGAGRVLP